jgi:hypothetical protein
MVCSFFVFALAFLARRRESWRSTMLIRRALMHLVTVALVAACGSDPAPPMEMDAGRDAAIDPPDAGPLDAGSADSGDVWDAGTFPPDEDSDGIPDASDCDPMDPTVGATATEACENACGDGSRTCADGTWTECDAPTDCFCDTPGATRIVPCARCGSQGQRCTAGAWVNNGSCLGAGECEAGQVEVEDPYPDGYCGRRERLCTTACGWDEWEVTRPSGECARRPEPYCLTRTDRPLEVELVICTDECTWLRTGEPCF